MTPLQTFATELESQLKTFHHVTLITHCRPDGDAVGSLEGMRGLLRLNHPHLTVDVVMPPEIVDTHIAWVLGETIPTLPAQTDLVLFLDTALASRTSLPPEIFTSYNILSIDHHEAFVHGYPGFRDSSSPSATILLTEIAQYLNWEIDTKTATALLLGIYTDTGGFIHRNTNARALSTAAYLLSLGGDHTAIAQKVFGNNTLEYLHQLGRGLQDITIVDNIAILCLPSDIE